MSLGASRVYGVAAMLLTISVASALASCAQPGVPAAIESAEPAPAAQTIRVFAAASLTEVFHEMSAAVESAHPWITVELVFAGSSELAAQIAEGAPADVFASANEESLAAVAADVTSPQRFASNTLTIVVPQGNPEQIADLDDLTRDDVVLVLCAPQVPCGAATNSVESAAGLTFSPASEESNVTDVLGKVASGQADAGLVYVTDVARAEGVEGIPFAESGQAVNLYPIGVVAASEHEPAAQVFVDFVLSPAGQRILATYGFAAP